MTEKHGWLGKSHILTLQLALLVWGCYSNGGPGGGGGAQQISHSGKLIDRSPNTVQTLVCEEPDNIRLFIKIHVKTPVASLALAFHSNHCCSGIVNRPLIGREGGPIRELNAICGGVGGG